ncbi:Fe2+-dependent dioxygenase [Thermosynechococcus vestitus]|uniref:PKHD-type hydroxylase tll1907 n=1 Tax=Thermosynechococcus vestitus (strain NIES-2133 / IAM M-273 / BP-1) TaxID=197221 RepID=Y1907_THEVB|nr:Fe2+-dependent dioxygenase [Thermosynechococcus vestitus]Q8DHN8.2 RecName: Full=PKHD-type hydroxylase tll1907 [Thermosynechococcus vestitus BP-1]
MLLQIDRVLTTEELNQLNTLLQAGVFEDGKWTAGIYAKTVKDNQQLVQEGEEYRVASEIVLSALSRNQLFQAYVQPKIIGPLLFSRYEVGMAYGTHTDNALMGSGDQLRRSDVSLTIFLNDPFAYEGGALVLDTSLGEQYFKLPAGSMIVYPSIFLHRVETVSKGVRLVAVAWVQSLIRDPLERELLFELDTVRRSLFEKQGKTVDFDLLCKVYSNLLRKWAEI